MRECEIKKVRECEIALALNLLRNLIKISLLGTLGASQYHTSNFTYVIWLYNDKNYNDKIAIFPVGIN